MSKATRFSRDRFARYPSARPERPESQPTGAFRRQSMIAPVREVTSTWPAPAPLPALTPETRPTVSEALVSALLALGVEHAFGVFGGGIAPFCEAVSRSEIRLIHCRHEASAAFAAIESSLATGRLRGASPRRARRHQPLHGHGRRSRRGQPRCCSFPATRPPRSAVAARFRKRAGPFSAALPAFLSRQPVSPRRDRRGSRGARLRAFAPDERLRPPPRLRRTLGLAARRRRPARRDTPRPRVTSGASPVCASPSVIAECVELLASEEFVIWAGFGARMRPTWCEKLAEESGARVMCTPRGKGVMPERHPLFLGVTGLGGHARVDQVSPPRASSAGARARLEAWAKCRRSGRRSWCRSEGLIHVDLGLRKRSARRTPAPRRSRYRPRYARSCAICWSRGPRSRTGTTSSPPRCVRGAAARRARGERRAPELPDAGASSARSWKAAGRS